MTRILVVPAAGRGSRLGWTGPKILCPVAGRPMLDHFLETYAPFASRIVVVASPDGRAKIDACLTGAAVPAESVVQAAPTGMLPAILCARDVVLASRPDEVWVTWGDQIAIRPATAARLARELAEHPGAALVFPTVSQTPPYIHFDRDAAGRIIAVRQRREGDAMPETGESDAGLFGMRGHTYLGLLPEFDAAAAAGTGTAERNFLPFLPWLAARAEVRTFALEDPMEAVGINTPADLAAVERYLRGRRG